MSKSIAAVIGLFAGALALGSPMARASTELIQNGGFEVVTNSAPGLFTGVQPTPWQCAGPNCGSGAVAVFSPGSAVPGGPCCAGFSVYPGFPDQSPLPAGGGNFLGVDPCFNSGPAGSACSPSFETSVIYQEADTAGGLLAPGTYALNFWQAGAQWNTYLGPTTTQWEVGLGNTCLINCSDSAMFAGEIDDSQLMVNTPGGDGTNGTYVAWEAQTLYFTVPTSAAATPQYLSFVPLGNIAVPPVVLLDGVSFQPVPEPGTWLLMVVGLFGLCGVGLRRRARRGESIVDGGNAPNPAERGSLTLGRDVIAGECSFSSTTSSACAFGWRRPAQFLFRWNECSRCIGRDCSVGRWPSISGIISSTVC